VAAYPSVWYFFSANMLLPLQLHLAAMLPAPHCGSSSSGSDITLI